MKEIRLMLETCLRPRSRTIRDLCALNTTVFAVWGGIALYSRSTDFPFEWVVVAMMGVLFVAVGQENHWFRRRRKSRPR